MYAKEINGQIETTRSLRTLYPNTSFPQDLQGHDGWKKVVDAGAGAFEVKDSVVFVDGTPTQTYTTSEALKEAYLADYRWKVETGGITVSGVTVQTDATSRANILGAKELGTAVKWKTPSGFVQLTAEQVSAIATAVGQHVQKCFEAEATVIVDIADYDTPAEVEAAFDAAFTA